MVKAGLGYFISGENDNLFMYKPKLDKDIRYPLEYGLDIFGGK